MAASSTKAAAKLERELGQHSSGRPGPLLIAIGGIHGNEPAGVSALRTVLGELRAKNIAIEGRLVALVGNLQALARNRRYVERDLNRMWTEAELKELAAADPKSDEGERREQRELLAAIEAQLADGPWTQVFLLDLHSTSGVGPPFTIVGDTVPDRKLALDLCVPTIVGLKENIAGTLLEHISHRGHLAVVLEGGQNEAPTTVEHHEAAVWLMLAAAGMWQAPSAERERHRATLAGAARGLPSAVRIRLRYAIDEGETFKMEPGFKNFDRVARGQLLARSGDSGEHEIRAPIDSILLMPRYQGQGEDGFFLGFGTRPF
jgi:succinylglutamate desuccinylase